MGRRHSTRSPFGMLRVLSRDRSPSMVCVVRHGCICVSMHHVLQARAHAWCDESWGECLV